MAIRFNSFFARRNSELGDVAHPAFAPVPDKARRLRIRP